MSKSRPFSVIDLTESEKSAVKKMNAALTGGRDTVEEQRKIGGQPDKCMVFSMLKYHLVEDDKTLLKWKEECKAGSLTCGECKMRTIKLLAEFLEDHQKKRKQAENKLEDYGIKA